MHVLFLGLALGTIWLVGKVFSPTFKQIGQWCGEIFRSNKETLRDWTTLNGLSFEEVSVRAVVANEVIFRHKLGIDCLPLSLLNEEARMQLAVIPVPVSIPVRGR